MPADAPHEDPDAFAHSGADRRVGYEPVLYDLLGLYPNWVEANVGAGIRHGYQRVAHIAHGWYMRVHRSIEVILLLDPLGYAEEAVGIRRSMIEHVLALKWLAAEGDALEDTLARGHAKAAHDRLGANTNAGWTVLDPEQLQAVIDSADADARSRDNDYLLVFRKRLEKYGDAHTLPEYLASCERVHPSYESAVAYIELPDGHYRATPRNPLDKSHSPRPISWKPSSAFDACSTPRPGPMSSPTRRPIPANQQRAQTAARARNPRLDEPGAATLKHTRPATPNFVTRSLRNS